MNSSGDAAEQIVRMSLEGVEVAAKITGSAAKNVAAMLYAILKNRNPKMAKGRKRLAQMLKIDRPISVFTTSADNAKIFKHEAKEYGFAYFPIPNKKKFNDGQMDFLVFKDDANKINRIAERFKLSTVDTATIKTEIEKNKNGKPAPVNDITGDNKVLTLFAFKDEHLKELSKELNKNGVDYRVLNGNKPREDGKIDILVDASQKEKVDGIMGKMGIENFAPRPKDSEKPTPEITTPDKNKDAKLLDELMGKPTQKEQSVPQNPQMAKTDKSPLSEPTSTSKSKTAEGTTKSDKPSVLGDLKGIKSEQEQKAALPKHDEKSVSGKSVAAKGAEHRQPQPRKKNKNKSKGR